MSDPTEKKCGQCGAVQPATNEFFGADKQQPDSLRRICKECYSDNRYGDRTKAVQALRVYDKLVIKAERELKDNLANLSPGQIEKYERIVRLAPEHRAELQKKILDARAAEELAQRQAAESPSLKLVQERFGSPIFLTTDEIRESLEKARIALTNLTGEHDGPARQHVEAYITRVGGMVKERDELAADMAHDQQEILNEEVSRRVIGRLQDEWLPRIRQASTKEQQTLLRQAIRAKKKKLMAMAKDGGKDKSGADKSVVARVVADALEKLALLCYGAKAPLVADTLASAQSRADIEAANYEYMERIEAERRQYWDDLKARDFKQWELESRSLVRQIKGNDYWSKLQRDAARRLIREDPQEAIRRALLSLKPKSVEMPTVVYVIQEGRRETWLWGDGRLVKRGEEVTYDARMKAWFLMPGPVGIELDPIGTKGRQTMEWYQDENDPNCTEDGPVWKQRPADSAGVWEQKNDGSFKRVDNPSPWQKPQRLTFRKAPAHVEGSGKDHFRLGEWWSDEDIKKAEAADAANPPVLLPPLTQFPVADSVATPVPHERTPAEREKENRPVETVWQRHEREERIRKAREAELLQAKP